MRRSNLLSPPAFYAQGIASILRISQRPQYGQLLKGLYGQVGDLVDLLLPRYCPICGSDADGPAGLCGVCFDGIEWIDGPCCTLCGIPFPSRTALPHHCPKCLARPPAFARARSVARYTGAIAHAVHRMKFSRVERLAVPLGKIILDNLPPSLDPAAFSAVVPVPLHAKRLRSRGFNQSLLLARRVSRGLGLPVAGGLVDRLLDTPSQLGLGIDDRRRNVRGAFVVRKPALVEGAAFLIVDDVLTTGATASELAR